MVIPVVHGRRGGGRTGNKESAACLQNVLKAGVCGECFINVVKLCAADGGDGDGHAQVFALFALTQLNGGRIKRGVELASNCGDGVHKSIFVKPHDFDGELARIGDEAFFFSRRCAGVGQ